MVISSLENDRVKYYTKLSKKKFRDSEGKYLVEGEHLVSEAIKAGVVLEVIVLEGYECDFSDEVIYVTREVLCKISNMDTPPVVMAVCSKKETTEVVGERVVLLDEIQDPGNLGTIIRSSLAFGVETIVLTEGSVDLYNSKVLRATQGMIFHINIINMDIYSAINYMKSRSIPVYGTSVVNGVDAYTLESHEKEKFCLVMGNEGNGLSHEVLDKCDKNLYIKMNDKVESLNVGVACSILLYELGR